MKINIFQKIKNFKFYTSIIIFFGCVYLFHLPWNSKLSGTYDGENHASDGFYHSHILDGSSGQ
jgi:hypothetical protein